MILDEKEISQLGIPIEPEQGIADGLLDNAILNRHNNLCQIDFWRLGYISEYFIELANNPACYGLISEKNLFHLIQSYVQLGKIDCSQMKQTMRASYESHLDKFKCKLP